MDETPRTEARTAPTPQPTKRRGRGILWTLIAVVVAFAAGFLWQYFEAASVRGELADTEQALQVERVRVQLAQAAIAAQAGEYETARQQMSTLFNQLDAGTEALPEDVRPALQSLLSMRDDIITGLSRANPETAGVLFTMLQRLRAAEEPPAYAPAGPAPAAGEPAAGEPATAAPSQGEPDTAAGDSMGG